MKSIAESISDLRSKAGLSMRELSLRSGVPKSAISNIESGKTTNPCVGTLGRLASAMGYDLKLAFITKENSFPETNR